jgi:arylsulfatase A-like enzyme
MTYGRRTTLAHGANWRVRSVRAVALAVAFTFGLISCSGGPGAARRPNVVLIVSDDQRYDSIEFMPLTKARIFDEGVTFTSGYVSTGWCCPSRASVLTGRYAHNHGVHLNSDPLDETTLVQRLHEHGYYTGLVGKYLNSWDGAARPEFDFWVAWDGGKSRYFDPTLNVNGVWGDRPGYMTYILRDYAVQFLGQAAEQDKPFLLIFAPNAPHHPYDPAPGDEDLYMNVVRPWPPNYNEQDISDKPVWLQGRSLISPEDQEGDLKIRRLQWQMLWSLDQSIGAILDALDRQGQLDNTLIIYLSDNGLLINEHRLAGKAYVYEEVTHVPFALRYPSLLPAPKMESRLVANIDIAPTIYELVGIPIPPEVNGRSLVSLLQDRGDWRDDLLLEGWPDTGPYAAVHDGRYVYVETEGHRSELYDLEKDPYQLENRADDPEYAHVVTNLQERLKALLAE